MQECNQQYEYVINLLGITAHVVLQSLILPVQKHSVSFQDHNTMQPTLIKMQRNRKPSSRLFVFKTSASKKVNKSLLDLELLDEFIQGFHTHLLARFSICSQQLWC